MHQSRGIRLGVKKRAALAPPSLVALKEARAESFQTIVYEFTFEDNEGENNDTN